MKTYMYYQYIIKTEGTKTAGMRVLTVHSVFLIIQAFSKLILTDYQRKSYVVVRQHTLPRTLLVQQHTFSMS